MMEVGLIFYIRMKLYQTIYKISFSAFHLHLFYLDLTLFDAQGDTPARTTNPTTAIPTAEGKD